MHEYYCFCYPRAMPGLSRRTFLSQMSAVTAGGLVAAHAGVPQRTSTAGDAFYYYDDRFALARTLVAQLAGSMRPTPVQGDVTGVWNASLRFADARSMPTLHGITTESFHFCLKTLLEDRVRLITRLERIDQDLYLWSMRTTTPHSRGVI